MGTIHKIIISALIKEHSLFKKSADPRLPDRSRGQIAPVHHHFHLSACINRLKLLGADRLLRKRSNVRVDEDRHTPEEETITRGYANQTGSDLDKQNELRYVLF